MNEATASGPISPIRVETPRLTARASRVEPSNRVRSEPCPLQVEPHQLPEIEGDVTRAANQLQGGEDPEIESLYRRATESKHLQTSVVLSSVGSVFFDSCGFKIITSNDWQDHEDDHVPEGVRNYAGPNGFIPCE